MSNLFLQVKNVSDLQELLSKKGIQLSGSDIEAVLDLAKAIIKITAGLNTKKIVRDKTLFVDLLTDIGRCITELDQMKGDIDGISRERFQA